MKLNGFLLNNNIDFLTKQVKRFSMAGAFSEDLPRC